MSDPFEPGKRGVSSLSFRQFLDLQRFPALDGLRAVSIILVLLHHSPRFAEDGPMRYLRMLQENGRYGVSIFFLISGFLICTLLLREQRHTGRIDFFKFYGRRVVRLFPLYYALLLLQCVLIFALHEYSPQNQQLFREKLPSYLFYYSNWLPTMTQGPFFCAWSLAVEEQFYVGFGLLLALFSHRAICVGLIGASVLKVLAFHAFGPVDAGSRLFLVLFSYREPVLLGVLLGYALNNPSVYETLKRGAGSWPIILGALLSAAALLIGRRFQQESSWEAELFYVLIALALVGIITRPRISILSAPPATYLGKISYGVYLIHPLVFALSNGTLGATPIFLIMIVTWSATCALAAMSYRWFEEPIIKWFRPRLAPIRSAAEATQSATRLPLQNRAGVLIRLRRSAETPLT